MGAPGRSACGADRADPFATLIPARCLMRISLSRARMRDASEAQLQRSDTVQYSGRIRVDWNRRSGGGARGEKRRIVTESYRSEDSVSVVAQRNGVNASVLFSDRRVGFQHEGPHGCDGDACQSRLVVPGHSWFRYRFVGRVGIIVVPPNDSPGLGNLMGTAAPGHTAHFSQVGYGAVGSCRAAKNRQSSESSTCSSA